MSIPKSIEDLLREFYSEQSSIGDPAGIRCVVNGTPEWEWHHLDDNHDNNDLGNIIPLATSLNRHLGGLKGASETKDEKLFHEQLRPSVLRLKAQLHAIEWRLASAIGCLRLAYYISHRPYQDSDDNERLELSYQPVRYLRHHVNYDILNTTLRDIFKALSMKRPRVEALIAIKYNLIALLNEHGEHERARACALDVNSSLTCSVERRLSSDDEASIKRRILQIALLYPHHFPFSMLEGELTRKAENNLKLETSLANTKVLAALTSKNDSEIAAAYEAISSLCYPFRKEIRKGRKPGVGLSDLAEIFLYRAILAFLVKPPKYLSIVEESCKLSGDIFRDCHALITYQYPEFWTQVFQSLSINPFSDHPIARLVRKHNRLPLPRTTSNLVDTIFDQIRNTIAIV